MKRGREAEEIRAIDVFCGVGGLTHGLTRGGINVVAGVDVDSSCKFPYEANNKAIFLERDVNDLDVGALAKLYEGCSFALLAGCAPCQPFSTYSQPARKARRSGEWDLVDSFGQLVTDLQPHLVTMENVPQLEHHAVFSKFLSRLKGYTVVWKVVQCADIGIPQTRKRLVLLASRLTSDLDVEFALRPRVTVKEAISRLRQLEAGQSDEADALHIACKLSPKNLKRIRASIPGGTWRDWPAALRAACHRKDSGNTYPSVYGRMEWNKPAPTITTQCFGYGNGRFGHPKQDRAITLREAAMLQTFPESYSFVKADQRVRFAHLGRLIGNAVPVRLGQVIAERFRRHVDQHVRNTSKGAAGR